MFNCGTKTVCGSVSIAMQCAEVTSHECPLPLHLVDFSLEEPIGNGGQLDFRLQSTLSPSGQ